MFCLIYLSLMKNDERWTMNITIIGFVVIIIIVIVVSIARSKFVTAFTHKAHCEPQFTRRTEHEVIYLTAVHSSYVQMRKSVMYTIYTYTTAVSCKPFYSQILIQFLQYVRWWHFCYFELSLIRKIRNT